MANKQELIDFLIENSPLVKEIVIKSSKQIDKVPSEFQSEAKDQEFQHNKKAIIDVICKEKGLTSGSVNEILDEEELRKFLNEFNNDPW